MSNVIQNDEIKNVLERCQSITSKIEESQTWDIAMAIGKVYEELDELRQAVKNTGGSFNYKPFHTTPHDYIHKNDMFPHGVLEEAVDVFLSSTILFHKMQLTPDEIIHAVKTKLKLLEEKHGVLA